MQVRELAQLIKHTFNIIMMCQNANTMVGSPSGDLRQNWDGSVWLESGNVNEKF